MIYAAQMILVLSNMKLSCKEEMGGGRKVGGGKSEGNCPAGCTDECTSLTY